jgi:hypothetical protein
MNPTKVEKPHPPANASSTWSRTKKQKLATRAAPFRFGQNIKLSLLNDY